MGCKSRGNWLMNFCIRECVNKGIKCDDCVSFSCYLPPVLKDDDVKKEC